MSVVWHRASAGLIFSLAINATAASVLGLSDPVRESQAASVRIKQAQQRLAFYKAKASQAEMEQHARYQNQLETDRKADVEIRRLNDQTKKYQKDLAIAEFNQKRSEIALAYSRAKTTRQKLHQQKVYQRKIAAEREARTSSN